MLYLVHCQSHNALRKLESVFGADEERVKAVREGDSVTLNPDLTQIQGFTEIQWWFKDQLFAITDGRNHEYPENERFRDRLKLNQNGSLTITNMKTKHSGLYKLWIELNTGPLTLDFTVTVNESPSVIDAVKGEMKFESVKEGAPVTLQTDVKQLHGDELIVWRCGEEGKLIAKADMEAKSSPLYDTDGRFSGRLELDHVTGSLTLTNTRTTDSGLYYLQISSNQQTLYKRFTVTVSEPDLSPGAVAAIVIAVLAAVAVGVAGLIYYRRKFSELRKQMCKYYS
ncbi:uncharacterized protein LOC113078435 [Carassius auratus]|uniref:Uncharacterized protein LOC113078435 n=1 Tax=Carassius auratus TaxID=7957 RepID=A0A6P6NBE5_CARAU|nr:uncharacterized protein LOC113078435 [Carassius auratus]